MYDERMAVNSPAFIVFYIRDYYKGKEEHYAKGRNCDGK